MHPVLNTLRDVLLHDKHLSANVVSQIYTLSLSFTNHGVDNICYLLTWIADVVDMYIKQTLLPHVISALNNFSSVSSPFLQFSSLVNKLEGIFSFLDVYLPLLHQSRETFFVAELDGFGLMDDGLSSVRQVCFKILNNLMVDRRENLLDEMFSKISMLTDDSKLCLNFEIFVLNICDFLSGSAIDILFMKLFHYVINYFKNFHDFNISLLSRVCSVYNQFSNSQSQVLQEFGSSSQYSILKLLENLNPCFSIDQFFQQILIEHSSSMNENINFSIILNFFYGSLDVHLFSNHLSNHCVQLAAQENTSQILKYLLIIHDIDTEFDFMILFQNFSVDNFVSITMDSFNIVEHTLPIFASLVKTWISLLTIQNSILDYLHFLKLQVCECIYNSFPHLTSGFVLWIKWLSFLLEDDSFKIIVSDVENSLENLKYSRGSFLIISQSFWPSFEVTNISNIAEFDFSSVLKHPCLNPSLLDFTAIQSKFSSYKVLELKPESFVVTLDFSINGNSIEVRANVIQACILHLFNDVSAKIPISTFKRIDFLENYPYSVIEKELQLLEEKELIIAVSTSFGEFYQINSNFNFCASSPVVLSRFICPEILRNNENIQSQSTVYTDQFKKSKIEAFLVRLLKKNKRMSIFAIRKELSKNLKKLHNSEQIENSILDEYLESLAERELIVKEKRRKGMYKYFE
ncbi:hypothetical protein GEMRC1_009710 [Eukaryota sp. GEM-RC1]